ncbi:MAG: terminase small subunit protein [Candidatus Saccharimonadales bacterium]
MATRKVGRPTLFSPKMCQAICSQIAEGRSLREICQGDDFPVKSTVMRWLFEEDKKGFQDQYARAREIQAESMADELLSIADDGANDFMERNGVQMVDKEALGRSRLRIDTRKWVASKLLPKKYGEKLETTLKGDPTAPLSISIDDAKL